jgi:hypothetical protein
VLEADPVRGRDNRVSRGTLAVRAGGHASEDKRERRPRLSRSAHPSRFPSGHEARVARFLQMRR